MIWAKQTVAALPGVIPMLLPPGTSARLRAAIYEANRNGDTADTITFSVTGVITLVGTTLPVGLSDPSVAGPDGLAAGTTITGPASFGITVTGGGAASCFTLSSPTNTIQGLVISGCGDDGITVLGTSTGNIIRGNRIGTNAAGGAAFPNVHYGIDSHCRKQREHDRRHGGRSGKPHFR